MNVKSSYQHIMFPLLALSLYLTSFSCGFLVSIVVETITSSRLSVGDDIM